VRCGSSLAASRTDPLELPLAVTLTAAIVFVVANAAPLMDLSAVGRQVSTTIIGGTYRMWLKANRSRPRSTGTIR